MAGLTSVLLVLLVLPEITSGQNLNVQTCSRDNSAKIQPLANAWIGGIISLNAPGSGGFGCGNSNSDMQTYEAIRWVLELLNKKNETIQSQIVTDYYVPGIRLGMLVRNYCSKELTAVAAVRDIFPEMSQGNGTCTAATENFVLGVIGASSSSDAITLSDTALPYKIPVVSYEATASELTMSGMYPNFMRTTSPDGPLMEVIIKVITKLQWNYISVVYDSSLYGRHAYNDLLARAIASGICLTQGIMVDADNRATATATLNKVLSSNATGVIYFGPSDYARALFDVGNNNLPMAGRLQWLLTDISLSTIFVNTSIYQRGLIFVSVASRDIPEFEDHWIRINESNPSPENPWFTGWYEQRYNCKFNPTAGEKNCASLYAGMSDNEKELKKRGEFEQEQFLEAAVMSVFTYAKALRNAQMKLCPRFSGICPNLAAMSRETFMNDYLKKVDFIFTSDERVPTLASNNVEPYNAAKHLSFTSNGDVSEPSYYVYNYNDFDENGMQGPFKFRLVGNYIGSTLTLNLNSVGMYSANRMTRLIPLPSSPCPAQGCTPCLGLPSQIKYYFEQGDVVVNGIFSLHQLGATALTCGSMMSVNQVMFLEAMIYGVRLINQDSTILGNIMLGGLGMDDCSSTMLGQAFVAQVQRGNLQIKDKVGSKLDPRKIEAYSAAHTTALTLPLAEAMNMLMKPMVGYRASGSLLDDKLKYPYYLRSFPGNYEIKAIILFLKRMNWMYVQVITSKDYSQNSENLLRQLAPEAGICIVATHNIGQSSQEAMDVVSGLAINSAAPPTIVLLLPQDIRRLLEAFNNSMATRKQVVLIGTTKWATDRMIVKDYESVSEGAITLSLSSNLDNFAAYLSSLRVDSYTLNPWFKEWFAAAHNCSLGDQGSGSPCNQSKAITEGVNFQLIYEVKNVINAIRAIGYGLHNTLRDYCGNNYMYICSSFLTSKDRGMRFLESIRNVSFIIENTSPAATFGFLGNSAKIPYDVNYYTQNNYNMAGNIDPWLNTVTVNPASNINQLANTVKPSCPAPCLDCLTLLNNYWFIPGDLVIASIFDVHYAGSTPFSCEALKTKNGALYTEVFNYALQKINSGMTSVKLRNVTLGGLAFDGCSSPDRATAIVNRVQTGANIVDNESGKKFMPSSLISWMSYDSQMTIDTASLVQKLGIPIVSPGATASELDDKQKYYTFFRTIPSDSVVVRGMAEFIRNIQKKYVIVLNAPETSSRQSRDLFRTYLNEFGICIVANYEFITDGNMDIIVNNIARAETSLVAVFADPDNYINDLLNKSGNLPLIYVANRNWGPKVTNMYSSRLTNSVFFDLNVTNNMAEFINYLGSRPIENNKNPWFSDIYQAVMNCDFPGTFRGKQNCNNARDQSNWEVDIWTLSTINAIYSLAEAVHRTLQSKCGADYMTVCPDFMNSNNISDVIMSNMDMESFTDIMNNLFSFIQREANTRYLLMRFNNPAIVNEGYLDSVGHLNITGGNVLNGMYTSVKSNCAGECLVCKDQKPNYQDFTFVAGDFYIVGLFDVHNQGNSPFTCGGINDRHGLPLLEAFNYALEYVNSNSGIFKDVLPGVMLGGVGLDMCKSPSRAAELIANIQSGNIEINRNGFIVNPRKVDAYIGAMDTESTIRVADILQQLGIPQVSYGAKGMDLLNRLKYSYFLRSVPADDKEARAIVSYLKKLNYNNIQVIYSFDEEGEPGRLEFKRLAYANKICVNYEYPVNENGSVVAEAANVLQRISQTTNAQVVVLWLKDPLPILEAANNNNVITMNTLFIATDRWGANPDYLTLTSIRNVLQNKNLVILDVETADIFGFDKYLDTKNPDNYLADPWFKEYYEQFRNCSWDGLAGLTPCDKASSIPRAVDYMQDSYVLYVINAVFSVALAIDSSIREVCFTAQSNYYGACSEYSSSGERRQYVMKNLLKVNFTDDTLQPFYYTEDGQSSRGFHIYNITSPVPNEFHYENVGSYNDTHFLKLDITYDTNFNAQCDANNNMCVCKFKKDLPSTFVNSTDGGLSVVYVGDIHQANPTDPLGCGPMNTGVDLQNLLAFYYAIYKVNELHLPKSLVLNGIAVDTCTHGLRLGQDIYSIISGSKFCDSDDLLVQPSTITAFIVDKDQNALPVANMLSLQNITSISPTAGSALLTNKYMYPYFLRTTGDNTQTANVILQVAQLVLWDYVTVIYTDSPEYKAMADSLMDSSRQMNTCVGDAVTLPANATLEDAENALQKISKQIGSKAVVLFVDPSQIGLLMEASQSSARKSNGLAIDFVWVVGSEWYRDSSQILGHEQEFAGALIINQRSAILSSYTEYVKSLNYMNRGGIPDSLFYEIYEAIHQCNIITTERLSANHYAKTCSLNEVITDAMVQQNSSVLYVILSVYSVAFGLENIPECNMSPLELYACLQVQVDKYNKIYKGISGVDFTLPELAPNNSFPFTFNQDGSGQAGYVIDNYRISSGVNENPYRTYQIGQYTNQGLVFNRDLYAAGNLYDTSIPTSNCAVGSTCSCQLSNNRKWTYSAATILDPTNVQIGKTYKDPVTGEAVTVEAVPDSGDRFVEGWAIVLSILACLGALVSLIFFVYLLIMYPERGGTSILGFIHCFGIFLLYLMCFPFIAHAGPRMCGLRRFGLGFVYAIAYIPLFIKLVDCCRVLGKKNSEIPKYSKFGTAAGLFLATVFLVLIQVMINAEWLILVEPTITRIFYKNQYWPLCMPTDFYDKGLVLSLVYIMVIIFISLLLALRVMMSGIIINQKENRWILCIIIISIICWVIWCTASILGAMKMRDAAVVVGLLVNATVMLILMPIRKLYLLIKSHVIDEDKEKDENQSTLAPSQKGTDRNSVYGRQYDNNPRLHDGASNRGSTYAAYS